MKFVCSADKGGYQYRDQGYWIIQNNLVTKLVTCGKNVLRTSSKLIPHYGDGQEENIVNQYRNGRKRKQ